jgi:hypothetical protein
VEPIGCPETSLQNYYSTLYNIQEKRNLINQLHNQGTDRWTSSFKTCLEHVTHLGRSALFPGAGVLFRKRREVNFGKRLNGPPRVHSREGGGPSVGPLTSWSLKVSQPFALCAQLLNHHRTMTRQHRVSSYHADHFVRSTTHALNITTSSTDVVVTNSNTLVMSLSLLAQSAGLVSCRPCARWWGKRKLTWPADTGVSSVWCVTSILALRFVLSHCYCSS